MATAVWNNVVLADSNETVVVEGNHYFPAPSLDRKYFKDSAATTVCGWKGTANYFDLVVDGEVNEQAAWYYADPKPEAESIRDHVAFWKGVQVTP